LFITGVSIRTTTTIISHSIDLETTEQKRRSVPRISFKRASKRLKKRLITSSVLTVNLLLLLVVFAFVVHKSSGSTLSASISTINSPSSSSSLNDPLDQLSSADIAQQAAQMTGIAETTAVTNLAESDNAQLNVVASDNQLISKPQIVSTALKTRQDIVKYTAQPGDTVSSLAVKYGVTSSSIDASNGLEGNTLTPGSVLYIPPINGIVYTIKSGDTATSLASSFSASAPQIISFNDAELAGFTPGEQIVIPNGSEPVAVPTYSSYSSSPEDAEGYTPLYGNNGYDYGYCTWYVASQIPVPSNWGNASSWAYYAALSGWNVSAIPTVGSIAQTADAAGGQGHVAIVKAVSGNQILIYDMNNYGDGGGYGEVGHAWVSASTFQNFISR
jgi:surface antigen